MSACHVLAKAQCNSQPLHCVESNACESLIGNHRRQILVESLVPSESNVVPKYVLWQPFGLATNGGLPI